MTNGNDRSRWNWLLAIPVALPLATFLFNFDGPRLGGFPLFYWLQLAFVGLVVAVTTLVYRLSKRER
ncbi:DUF3311 domain-containing protein [Paractinoplanes atraurantiacus]|uniref:Uncharacterized protein n=1 Tax=Paractinoplanes atraurantiacus TaxID=1036182 RepID=A0A285GRB1_9ACTN|nr:DUF3311 domain-containing protein [Actinoplanes atraurantiacus]SNY26025.1 Protein of unknown function [Actinoplanes atraurantiacus]